MNQKFWLMQQLLVLEVMVEVEVQMLTKCVHIMEGLATLWMCAIGSMASLLTSNSKTDIQHKMSSRMKMQMWRTMKRTLYVPGVKFRMIHKSCLRTFVRCHNCFFLLLKDKQHLRFGGVMFHRFVEILIKSLKPSKTPLKLPLMSVFGVWLLVVHVVAFFLSMFLDILAYAWKF